MIKLCSPLDFSRSGPVLPQIFKAPTEKPCLQRPSGVHALRQAPRLLPCVILSLCVELAGSPQIVLVLGVKKWVTKDAIRIQVIPVSLVTYWRVNLFIYWRRDRKHIADRDRIAGHPADHQADLQADNADVSTIFDIMLLQLSQPYGALRFMRRENFFSWALTHAKNIMHWQL